MLFAVAVAVLQSVDVTNRRAVAAAKLLPARDGARPTCEAMIAKSSSFCCVVVAHSAAWQVEEARRVGQCLGACVHECVRACVRETES